MIESLPHQLGIEMMSQRKNDVADFEAACGSFEPISLSELEQAKDTFFVPLPDVKIEEVDEMLAGDDVLDFFFTSACTEFFDGKDNDVEMIVSESGDGSNCDKTQQPTTPTPDSKPDQPNDDEDKSVIDIVAEVLNLKPTTAATTIPTALGTDDVIETEKNYVSESDESDGQSEDGEDDDGEIKLQRYDIVLGRDGLVYKHPGNILFRKIIAVNREEYQKSKKQKEKTVMTDQIVGKIRAYGGRFLKRDEETKRWTEATNEVARHKVSHALRSARDPVKKSQMAKIKKEKKKEESSDVFGKLLEVQRKIFEEMLKQDAIQNAQIEEIALEDKERPNKRAKCCS